MWDCVLDIVNDLLWRSRQSTPYGTNLACEFFFIVLNSYLSNGYTDIFSITSWSAKPEVFTLWPSKKTFAER